MRRSSLPDWAMPFPSIIQDLLQLNAGGTGISAYDVSGSDLNGTLTGARPSIKPFIVGLVPPDFPIKFVPIERNLPSVDDLASSPPSAPSAAPSTDTSNVVPNKSLPDSFYRKVNQVAKNNKCSPADLLGVLWFESGIDPARTTPKDRSNPNGPVVARGLNMFTPVGATAAGISKDFWANDLSRLSADDQMYYVDKFFNSVRGGRALPNIDALYLANFAPKFIDKATQPDAVLYSSPTDNYKSNAHLDTKKKGYITVSDATTAVRKSMESRGYKAHLARLKAVVGEEAVRRPDAPVRPAPPVASSSRGLSIMGSGEITDVESEDPLRQTGRNIRVSDARAAVAAAQVEELQRQVAAMQNCKSLLMLVNPRDFTRSYEHSIDSPVVRRGHVVHTWLEKPLTITSSGVTAAQYAYNASGDGGLTHQNRVQSLSYRNLLSLIMLYRNNGNIFTAAPSGDPLNSGVPLVSAALFIYYDGHVYIGSFDEFSVTDAADKPFNMQYSWKFTARYEFSVASTTDSTITRGLF